MMVRADFVISRMVEFNSLLNFAMTSSGHSVTATNENVFLSCNGSFRVMSLSLISLGGQTNLVINNVLWQSRLQLHVILQCFCRSRRKYIQILFQRVSLHLQTSLIQCCHVCFISGAPWLLVQSVFMVFQMHHCQVKCAYPMHQW